MEAEAVRDTYLENTRVKRQNAANSGQCSLLENSTVKSTKSFVEAQHEADDEYNAQLAEHLRAKGYTAEAGRCAACGEVVTWKICKNGHRTPHRYSNCDLNRLCPRCARIEREAEIERTLEMVRLIQSKPVIGYRWRSIVLTVKTDGKYREAAERGIAAFQRLWRKRLKADLVACLRRAEFGQETGNVHFHCLYYGPYVDQGELSSLWLEFTGDSWNVRVSEIKGENLEYEIRELVKYITKFECEDGGGTRYPDIERTVAIWEDLRGSRLRLHERYGLFRHDCLEAYMKKPLEEPEVRKSKRECPDCGAPIDRIEYNPSGEPTLPRPLPDPGRLKRIHERARRRTEAEDRRAIDCAFDAYQRGEVIDFQEALRRTDAQRRYIDRQQEIDEEGRKAILRAQRAIREGRYEGPSFKAARALMQDLEERY